jgi:protein gp37
MSDRSKIQWTDASWNPTQGCSKISPGCENCYAMKIAARFSGPGKWAEGLAHYDPLNWTGILRTADDSIDKPLHWKRPRMVFVNSMSDLFHKEVPDEWIDEVFFVMSRCEQHTFQILTKRAERLPEYFARRERLGCPVLKNVWLGVSVENQEWADKRIPRLLETKAAVRFLSCEPLLGWIDLERHLLSPIDTGHRWCDSAAWVIVGGESGTNARRCHVDGIKAIVDQCKSAGVPVFVKQLGSKPIDTVAMTDGDSGTAQELDITLKDPKGGNPAEWPEYLRVREFPKVVA